MVVVDLTEDRELLALAMQEVHLHNADLKKAALLRPVIQKQEGKQQKLQFQVMMAEDDETCMQVRTYMLQFACNTDMIFLPGKNQFDIV